MATQRDDRHLLAVAKRRPTIRRGVRDESLSHNNLILTMLGDRLQIGRINLTNGSRRIFVYRGEFNKLPFVHAAFGVQSHDSDSRFDRT